MNLKITYPDYSPLHGLDRDMFDALAAVDVASADADTRRFLSHTLRDYRRAGVDQPAAVALDVVPVNASRWI